MAEGREFPKCKYHPTGGGCVVKDAAAEIALGPDWVDPGHPSLTDPPVETVVEMIAEPAPVALPRPRGRLRKVDTP